MLDVRSLLFVPGHRPERFAKALASGADLVCIDLEDAVPIAQKAEARQAVGDVLRQASDRELVRLVVRVSSTATADGHEDLRALAQAPLPRAVMLAKTETPEDVSRAAEILGRAAAWIALVESPLGLLRLEQICQQGTLEALMFGGGDYAAQLGAEFAWEPLLWARSQMVAVAAAYRLPVIDVPFLNVQDEEALIAETRRVSALGFSAKAAIHPAQVNAIHCGFLPGEEAVAEAREVIEAFEAARGGAVVVKGRMVDQPIVDAARRVLERSEIHSLNSIAVED